MLAAALLLLVGAAGGYVASDNRADFVLGFDWSTGVSEGLRADGAWCMTEEDGGERCAHLRLDPDLDPPAPGTPVHGVVGKIPSDDSNLPLDWWLWLTPLDCDSTGQLVDRAC